MALNLGAKKLTISLIMMVSLRRTFQNLTDCVNIPSPFGVLTGCSFKRDSVEIKFLTNFALSLKVWQTLKRRGKEQDFCKTGKIYTNIKIFCCSLDISGWRVACDRCWLPKVEERGRTHHFLCVIWIIKCNIFKSCVM